MYVSTTETMTMSYIIKFIEWLIEDTSKSTKAKIPQSRWFLATERDRTTRLMSRQWTGD